ncbi:putative guanine nucleotide exchange factor mss4 [Cokeromyces recurvatus]|uniref:putative guanine nucleotide exchange factor mss4 n=1 Tax=Cokeromyces recurvatus TaxID=90255 RepID=UPI00221E4BFB|nr:putative guanine nucleotide exchange factor mss4 [Cokeromyces recurvatus]KAI7901714.1 putative guanine nucleotide exchange factor mss4 [Cokeromyces recurvatus]
MIELYKSIEDPLTKLVAENGKNNADILCPKENCNCVILRKNTASLVERDGSKLALPESALPANTLLNADDDTHFWHVSNMMDFENVGFSTTMGTTKYLSCADCDLGPIGYHDTTNPKEFVVSIKRARYRF